MTNKSTDFGLPEEIIEEVRLGLAEDVQTLQAFENWKQGHQKRLAKGVGSGQVLHQPQSAEVRRAVVSYFQQQVILGLAEWRVNLAKMKLDSASDAVRNALEEFEPSLSEHSAWTFDPQLYVVLKSDKKEFKPEELTELIFTAARRLLALPLPELRSLRVEGPPRAMVNHLPSGIDELLKDLADMAVNEGPEQVRACVDEIFTVPSYATHVQGDGGAPAPMRFLAELATKGIKRKSRD